MVIKSLLDYKTHYYIETNYSTTYINSRNDNFHEVDDF